MRGWARYGQLGPWLRDAGAMLLVLLVMLAVIPFGSVMSLPFLLVGTGLLGFAVFSGIFLDEPQQTRTLFRLALAIVLVFSFWTFLQSLNLGFLGVDHSIWSQTRALLSGQAGAISIEPADTRFAMLTMVVPIAVFLTGLMYAVNEDRAKRMMGVLGACGGLVAVFAVAQFMLSPKTLIVIDKRDYLDSLTGVFVNRNTAATFFGLVVLINLARIRDAIPTLLSLRKKPGLVTQINFLLMLIFASTAALALLMTRSRAGIVCGAIAVLIYGPFLVSDWIRQTRGPRAGRWHPALAGGASFLVILSVFLLMAGQAIMRLKERGVAEDDRVCILPGIARAIGDSPWTGTGFGTFRMAFAPYRDAPCGIFGIFDRAHNGYLEGYMGLGLLFPLLLVPAVAALLHTFYQGYRNRRRGRHYGVLGLSALLLVLLHTAVDFSLQIPGFAIYFAAFLAPVCSLCLVRAQARVPIVLPGPVSNPDPDARSSRLVKHNSIDA